MKERGEGRPSREILNHLLSVQTAEIDPANPDICALYGVSTDVLTNLILTGKLVNFEEQNRGIFDLPVTPTQGMLPKLTEISHYERISPWIIDNDVVRLEGEANASYSARLHHFLSSLHLPLTALDLEESAREYLYYSDPQFFLLPEESLSVRANRMNNALEAFMKVVTHKDLSKTNIKMKAREAQERKGFLLGISSNAPVEIKSIAGTVKIDFSSKELCYQAITALEPLGKHEKKFLARLRRF